MKFLYKDLEEHAKRINQLGLKIIQKQNEIQNADSILSTIFDLLPCLIFYKDKENNILNINEFGAGLWGAKKEELLGKGWVNFLDNKALENSYFNNDLEVIKSGKPKLNIIEPLVSDRKRLFLTHKLPLMKDNEVIGIIGFSVEITESLEECMDGQRLN